MKQAMNYWKPASQYRRPKRISSSIISIRQLTHFSIFLVLVFAHYYTAVAFTKIPFILTRAGGSSTITSRSGSTDQASFSNTKTSSRRSKHATAILSTKSSMSSSNDDEIRPVITIFSITNCRFCSRGKSIFKEKSWSFQNINIEQYPKKRSDMMKLSNSLTVPQIFFGNEYIGGCEELEEWIKLHPSLETYDSIVNEFTKVSSSFAYDTYLSIPSYPPISEEESIPPPRNGDNFHHLKHLVSEQSSDKTLTTVIPEYVQTAEMLAKELPFVSTRGQKRVFRLEDLEHYLSQTVAKDVMDKAIEEMIEFQMIVPISAQENDTTQQKDKLLYRLRQLHTPPILNSYRIWKDRVDDTNPLSILNRLKSKIDALQQKYIGTGGLVDYQSMKEDPQMSVIDEASCELQHVCLSNMSEPTKKAFCINLYNVMIKHAFAKVGIPTDSSNRGPFFETVGYALGPNATMFYSFSDLENGILRGNKIPPGKTDPFFTLDDPRYAEKCTVVDPRIHFALNCGASSCPPIRKFTAEAVEEELHIVSMAYCQDEMNNVRFEKERNILYLNAIFNWYGSDFGSTAEEIGHTVLQWLNGEKKLVLGHFLKEGGDDLELEFLPYDWTSDALDPILPFNDEEVNNAY